MTRSPCHFLQLHWKTPKKIVYLTADTDTALETLAADEIYVIGGILDHNLLKGCTKEFADSAKLRTARLPISEHMVTTAGRKVLTVNQVYSALLGFWNWRCWRKALQFAIPKRKGFKLKVPLTEEEEKELEFSPHEPSRGDDGTRRDP